MEYLIVAMVILFILSRFLKKNLKVIEDEQKNIDEVISKNEEIAESFSDTQNKLTKIERDLTQLKKSLPTDIKNG